MRLVVAVPSAGDIRIGEIEQVLAPQVFDVAITESHVPTPPVALRH